MTLNNLPQELKVVLFNLLREYDRMEEKFGDGFTYGAIGSAIGDVLKYFEHLPIGEAKDIPLTEKTTADGILKATQDTGAQGREILFRGKGVNTGKWIYGNPFERRVGTGTPKEWYLAYDDGKDGFLIKIIPETLGQYTGLLDKDGRKIFEGDLIQTGGPLYLISFQDGAFVAIPENDVPIPLGWMETVHGIREYPNEGEHFLSGFSVSGNIHDNPVT